MRGRASRREISCVLRFSADTVLSASTPPATAHEGTRPLRARSGSPGMPSMAGARAALRRDAGLTQRRAPAARAMGGRPLAGLGRRSRAGGVSGGNSMAWMCVRRGGRKMSAVGAVKLSSLRCGRPALGAMPEEPLGALPFPRHRSRPHLVLPPRTPAAPACRPPPSRPPPSSTAARKGCLPPPAAAPRFGRSRAPRAARGPRRSPPARARWPCAARSGAAPRRRRRRRQRSPARVARAPARVRARPARAGAPMGRARGRAGRHPAGGRRRPPRASHTRARPHCAPRTPAAAAAAAPSYVMVKPDGVQRGLVGEIVGRFERKGFKLRALKLYQTPREARAPARLRLRLRAPPPRARVQPLDRAAPPPGGGGALQGPGLQALLQGPRQLHPQRPRRRDGKRARGGAAGGGDAGGAAGGVVGGWEGRGAQGAGGAGECRGWHPAESPAPPAPRPQVWEGDGVVASARKLIGATNPLASEPGTIRGDFAIQVGQDRGAPGAVCAFVAALCPAPPGKHAAVAWREGTRARRRRPHQHDPPPRPPPRPQVGRNVIHGSDSPENGEREVALWFSEGTVAWDQTMQPWLKE